MCCGYYFIIWYFLPRNAILRGWNHNECKPLIVCLFFLDSVFSFEIRGEIYSDVFSSRRTLLLALCEFRSVLYVVLHNIHISVRCEPWFGTSVLFSTGFSVLRFNVISIMWFTVLSVFLYIVWSNVSLVVFSVVCPIVCTVKRLVVCTVWCAVVWLVLCSFPNSAMRAVMCSVLCHSVAFAVSSLVLFRYLLTLLNADKQMDGQTNGLPI